MSHRARFARALDDVDEMEARLRGARKGGERGAVEAAGLPDMRKMARGPRGSRSRGPRSAFAGPRLPVNNGGFRLRAAVRRSVPTGP